MPKHHQNLKPAIFSILIVVIIFALIEASARLFGFGERIYFPLDETLGWYMVNPSHRYTPAGANAETVLLGDSVLYLDIEKPFSTTQILNQKGYPIINLSSIAFGNDQQLIMLKSYANQLPKVKRVILVFCLFNDFIENSSHVNPFGGYPKKPYYELVNGQLALRDQHIKYSNIDYLIHFLKNESGTYYYLQSVLKILGIIPKVSSFQDTITSWSFQNQGPTPPEWKPYLAHLNKGMPITKEILKTMSDYVTETMKAEFHILVHPSGFRPSKTAKDSFLELPLEYKTYFKELNLNAFDTGCYFKKEGYRLHELAYDRVGHLSRKGHEVFAQMLMKHIEQKNLPKACYL